MESPGGGELSLSAYPRVGNRPHSKKNNGKSPGVCPGGGVVTGGIEPYITKIDSTLVLVLILPCLFLSKLSLKRMILISHCLVILYLYLEVIATESLVAPNDSLCAP